MVSHAEDMQQRRRVARGQRTASAARDAADSRAVVNRMARAWLLGALVAGFGVALVIRFYGTHFDRLRTLDGVNVAQVARNVERGRGLKTDVIYPMHAALGDANDSRHDIAAGPLYAFALGMFFKGRGAEDSSVALFNIILLFITAAFVYALINLVYDKTTAIWGVLAYFISMKAISQALGAGGATMGALAVTAALYFGLVAHKNAQAAGEETDDDEARSIWTRLKMLYRSPWPWAVAAGLAAGLGYLTGMVGWLAIGGLVWVAAQIGERRRTALVVAGVLAVIVAAPWLARNFTHFGAPTPPLHSYSLLMYTAEFPGRSFMWQTTGLPESPALWAVTHPMAMVRKIGYGVSGFYATVPELVNRYLFPFLVVGLFVLPKTRGQRLLWGGVWFILLAQLLTGAVYDRDPDPLAVVTPAAIGLAVATLIGLMREHVTGRRAILGVGVAAALLVAIPYIASSVAGGPGPANPSKPALDMLATQVPRQALIATDNPWQVAWYGGKRALLLPESSAQLQALGQAGIEPDVVYLSGELRGARVERGREYWARILMTGQGVDDLPMLDKAQMLPNGEALITLEHAKAMIDELRERAAAAAADAEGQEGAAEEGADSGVTESEGEPTAKQGTPEDQ